MFNLVRTNSSHKDFITLVNQLDADLAIRDGDDHEFYNQFNSIKAIKYAVIGYLDVIPIACGAIKIFDEQRMEVKRMYTKPEHRGQGIASKILKDLEAWTSELGYKICVLETGKKQPEAIKLYKNNGYKIVANYGQYIGIDNSICFQKFI